MANMNLRDIVGRALGEYFGEQPARIDYSPTVFAGTPNFSTVLNCLLEPRLKKLLATFAQAP
jgi:hypothetical protein